MKLSRLRPSAIHDIYYIYPTIPKGKRAEIQKAFSHGLRTARAALGLWPPVTVRIALTKQKDTLTEGFAPGKRTILIYVTRMALRRGGFERRLASTAIHEYVHLLRHSLGPSKTVLDAAIEEGIAAYVQTNLSFAPEYLDIRTLTEKMVFLCKDKLAAGLFDPCSHRPEIWKRKVYREILYRLGYGIARRCAKDSHLDLISIIKKSRSFYVRFAKNYLKLEKSN